MGDVPQSIPSVCPYALAHVAFHHAERYPFVVNPKP